MSPSSAAFSHAEVRTTPPRLGGPLTPNRPNSDTLVINKPLASKNYGRIRVPGHASPRSWSMKPIAYQSGAVRIFDRCITCWRPCEAIQDRRSHSLLVLPPAQPKLSISSGPQLDMATVRFGALTLVLIGPTSRGRPRVKI